MSAVDLMPLFNRAVVALREGREIATTVHVVGMYDGISRVLISGKTTEARQEVAFNTGKSASVQAPRAAMLVTLEALPRTAQLALAGQYGEQTQALVVAAMERDRRPRCVVQPYELDNGRRVVDDLGGSIVITPPAEVIALLGRFWDGVEESEKIAAQAPRTVGRSRR